MIKKKHFNTEELISSAKKKDPGFDLYWLGVALERINTSKDDSAEMLLLLERLDFNDMVIFFNQWREKIARELIK